MRTTAFTKLTHDSKALETIQTSSHRLPVVRRGMYGLKKDTRELPGGNGNILRCFYGWWMHTVIKTNKTKFKICALYCM